MVKGYIKERINDQTTICSGGVTGNHVSRLQKLKRSVNTDRNHRVVGTRLLYACLRLVLNSQERSKSDFSH